jgi:SAM-dependent methyltransferase
MIQISHPQFDYDAVFEEDDYTYFYGDSLTEERSDAETNALVKILQLDKPMTILDLPCGIGRHSNRLAALGHSVLGMDLYPGFLELARKEAAMRGVRVDYRQGDMRAINFVEEFDRVMMLFTSFGYFEDDENFQVLENVRRALKPGGLFITDTHNRDVFLKSLPACHVNEKEGNLIIDRLNFDSLSGRMLNRRIVIRNGERKDKPFFVRLFNPTEMSDWLKRAGLEVQGLYGDWDMQPISEDARRMVVVARKPIP